MPPDVPLGLHDGYVSVVKSPQDFYIQLSGTEDPLADLSEELAELSESSATVNPINICPGYACSTKYSEDNNWYRAEIIDVQGKFTYFYLELWKWKYLKFYALCNKKRQTLVITGFGYFNLCCRFEIP